jgi:hypothetical protein
MGAWRIISLALVVLSCSTYVDYPAETINITLSENNSVENDGGDMIGTGPRGERVGKLQGWSQLVDMAMFDPQIRQALQIDFQPHAGMYTVLFGTRLPPAVPGGGFPGNQPSPIAEATVIWKVEGNRVARRFNVANGVALTGTGQAVEVSLQDFSVGGAFAGIKYQVSVLVSPGTRFSRAIPTLRGPFTFPLPILPGGGGTTGIFPIPNDAGIIGFELFLSDVTPGVAPHVTVAQFDNTGSIIAQDVDEDTGFIPLAAGAIGLEIVNKDPVVANGVQVSLLWFIDG